MAEPCINKTMDRADLLRPDCRLVLSELFGLMRRMQERGAGYSSWYGSLHAWPSVWEHINRGPDYEPWPDNPDELRVPWFLLWEIAWLVVNTPMKPGATVLDMGGAGSLFSCFLASRGHQVQAIDLQEDLCLESRRTADIMGWALKAQTMDMTCLRFPDESFDHVFSVCVLEHLPVSGRVQCGGEAARVLRPGGTASYTFDFANPQAFARLNSPADVQRQLVGPSGLVVRGNDRFHDASVRYLHAPQCWGFGRLDRTLANLRLLLTGALDRRRVLAGATSYTFGALFLQKPQRNVVQATTPPREQPG